MLEYFSESQTRRQSELQNNRWGNIEAPIEGNKCVSCQNFSHLKTSWKRFFFLTRRGIGKYGSKFMSYSIMPINEFVVNEYFE